MSIQRQTDRQRGRKREREKEIERERLFQKTEHKKTKKYTEKQKNIASDRKKYRTIHGYYDLQKRKTALHL